MSTVIFLALLPFAIGTVIMLVIAGFFLLPVFAGLVTLLFFLAGHTAGTLISAAITYALAVAIWDW